MSIWHPLFLAVAGVPLLSASLAAADVPRTQVQVEQRIVEVSTELLAGLGVAFNPVDAQYSSTGGQEPADTARTPTSGSGGGGVNLMGILFPDGTGLFGAGPTELGIGVWAEGSYASEESLIHIKRHPPDEEGNDVFGKRDLESAVDLTATVRIPLLTVPQVGDDGGVVISLQPLVGGTFTHVTTSLDSNQALLGGADLRESESEMKAGVVAGIGVTSKVPFLKDIPLLGGLFYKARRVPGSSVQVQSTLGFTEEFSVDGSWQHSVSLVLILPVTIMRDPFGD